ncbi:MAG: homoserine dehydrogenase [Ruminococcaceae bacterium]|nr:homoserine dehydrogenase [Oscillospiraceae bacterium]
MIGIAILGYGVVGSGVYEVIRTNTESITRRCGTEIDIKHILDIRDFDDHVEKHLFTKNFDDILTDPDTNIVVEVMGGTNPAYEFTKKALMAKKSVVTSNKELVAKHGCELLDIAAKMGVQYLFEASVGGGIPIIRPLRNCLAANEIDEITGILNGTTNYILTQMINENKSFEDALKEAQQKGYAEKDPTADVEGIDAVRKIAILSSLALGKYVDCEKIPVCGITKLSLLDATYAKKLGSVIKLCGRCKKVDNDKYDIYVTPMMIDKSHPIANVDDVFNAIVVNGNAVGETMFYGRGAGKLPTASAVVADVIDIVKTPLRNEPLCWVKSEKDILLESEKSSSKRFVRIETNNKEKTKENIKKVFNTKEFIDIEENEIGFITEDITNKEFDNKKLQLEDKIISTILVLS